MRDPHEPTLSKTKNSFYKARVDSPFKIDYYTRPQNNLYISGAFNVQK